MIFGKNYRAKGDGGTFQLNYDNIQLLASPMNAVINNIFTHLFLK